MVRFRFLLLVLFLVSTILSVQSSAFAQFPFRLKNPFHRDLRAEVTTHDRAGESRPFSRLLSVSAPIEKKDLRNYFQIADVIDTNKVLLDSGDIVSLAGLMSEQEIEQFRCMFPVDAGMKSDSTRAVIVDFMRAYLTERTVRVRFIENEKKDDQEHPLVYLYDEDGENINDLLVYEGYGVVSYHYVLDLHPQLIASQNEARSFGSGIWR